MCAHKYLFLSCSAAPPPALGSLTLTLLKIDGTLCQGVEKEVTLRIYGLSRQAVAASRSHHANRHNIYQHRVLSSSVHASRDLLRTEMKNYSFGCNSAYAIWRYPTPSYLILSLCQSISNRRQVRRCRFVVMLPYAPETFNPWFNTIIFNSVCNTINGLMSEVGRTGCSMLVLGIHI